jgi:hypothetical protein
VGFTHRRRVSVTNCDRRLFESPSAPSSDSVRVVIGQRTNFDVMANLFITFTAEAKTCPRTLCA